MSGGRQFEFPIDPVLVLQFARAIGDPSPVLDAPNFASLSRGGAILPPPTFLVAADHFDPQCSRRPAWGEAWPGSGRITDDWQRPAGRGQGFHAEQVFEYERHPRVGETLTVEVRAGREWQKAGRQGVLHFREVLSDYRDSDGAPVARSRWVTVAVHANGATKGPRGGTAVAPAEPTATSGAQSGSARTPSGLPPALITRNALETGSRWSEVVVEELTLSQIIRYAGASGDFIGVHHDARIARAAGYTDAFAHGMLTMALSGRLLTELVGTAQLRRFGARMAAVVYPGDTLTTTVAIDAVRGDTMHAVDLRVTTTNQHGVVVLTGSATADLSSLLA